MIEKYKGLNLPQLMELMHPLTESEAMAWTPQTVGWLVIAIWLMLVLLLAAAKLIGTRRRNRYRRQALTELKALQIRATQGEVVAGALAALLKRTALAAYPRRQVASLYGHGWADFLRRSSGNDRVVGETADELAAAAYTPDVDVETLFEPARRWINVHRVREADHA